MIPKSPMPPVQVWSICVHVCWSVQTRLAGSEVQVGRQAAALCSSNSPEASPGGLSLPGTMGHLPSGPQGHLRSWLSSREKFEDWVVLCLRAAWMVDEWGAGIVLDREEEARDQDPGFLTHSLLRQHREWDSLSLRGDPALGLTSF